VTDNTPKRLEGQKILLIEDDMVLLKSMAAQLIQAGATVTVALDGAAGLSQFAKAQPDLVITDIIMPEKEGIETIMAIRGLKPDVAILAISGGGRVGAAEFLNLAVNLGADAAMVKPFRSEDLIAKAAELLRT
jgi:DNA-binding response OmpR family regulator